MHAPTPYLNAILQRLIPVIYPVIGVACIFNPLGMSRSAPILVGITMCVAGIYSHVQAIRHHTYRDLTNLNMGISLLMAIIGGLILVKSDSAIELMGYGWGLLALYKGARLLDESFYYLLRKHLIIGKPLYGLINLILGCYLILDPAENFVHHIFLLGFELVVYSLVPLKTLILQLLNNFSWPEPIQTFLRRYTPEGERIQPVFPEDAAETE